MNPLKYILTLQAQVLLISFCIAQNTIIQQQEEQIYRQHRLQRAKIDSLQKILLTAKDTAKVNCLNRLSPEYYLFNTDTAWNCASEAYNLAVKINFTKGVAEGLLNLAQIIQERGNVSGAEKYFRQAPELYQKIHEVSEYNKAIRKLGNNLMLQLRFEEARNIFEKVLSYYKTVSDPEGLADSYRVIGKSYDDQGYFEKAADYFRKDMDISRTLTETGSRRSLFMWGNYYLASLYKDAGDKQTAIIYYRLSAHRALENKLPDYYNSWMGDINVLLENYDSARYYYKMAYHLISARLVDPVIRKNFLNDPSIHIGETFIKQKQYDSALTWLKGPLEYCFPPNPFTLPVLYDLAITYQGQKNISEALHYTKQLLEVASAAGARQDICKGFELIWQLYHEMGKKDSAYKYHLFFTSLKDTLANDEQLRNMAVAEMKNENQLQESKITLLNKEKKIQRQQKQLLFISLIGLVIISIAFYRNNLLKQRNETNKRKQIESALSLQQLEAERTKAGLQQKATELEMQALRAQMNPHFIFNSLNSINRFILQNNKAQASEYLTKFSRLVRLILQNSQASLITLESELESLQLYLELEAVRFDHHFEFKIIVENDLDVSALKIPPLIIQPYAENAIWHGLMHKEEKGHLEIELFQEEDFLCCRITDDGIGRNKAAELKSKTASTHKSMGMQITALRIEMLQKKKHLDTYIKVTDLILPDGTEGGTEVLLKIPVCYD